MRHHSYGNSLGGLIVGILIFCACEQQQLYNSSYYYYDLQVYINREDGRSENVSLRSAIIRVNGKDLDAISYRSGTYFVRIPFKDIKTISFDTQRSTGRSSVAESLPLMMRVETRTGETVSMDSIPNFYVRGHQSQYVERILQNDAYHFDVKEIRIIAQYDKQGQPTTQTRSQPGGTTKPRNSYYGTPEQAPSTQNQPQSSREGSRR